MFLNVWNSIRDFIVNLFSNIRWGNIFIFFMGIIVGFVICGMIYLIIFFKSIKKTSEINQKAYDEENVVKTEDVNKLIKGAKDQYKEEGKDNNINTKLVVIKDISWNLLNDIAKLYYPNSDHPVFELSVDELIKLSNYITEKVDKLFEGVITKYLRDFKITQLVKFIETKKKVDESKIVKASKKAHVGGIYKITSSIFNAINPVHWVRKIMISSSVNIGGNIIAYMIIDIVGQETAKVYSKNIFKDDNIDEAIELIDKELREE